MVRQAITALTATCAPRLNSCLPHRFCAILLILAAPIGFAQITSSITGKVGDPQGLPVAGAEILIRAEGAGAQSRATTDAEGVFVVVGLAPGRYSVTTSHPGFVTKSYDHLD